VIDAAKAFIEGDDAWAFILAMTEGQEIRGEGGVGEWRIPNDEWRINDE
jgi:hypothetical protein